MTQILDIIQYENFKFVVLPGSDPAPKYIEYYNKAYECWLSVWSDAYKEFGNSRHIYSDSFTRQTEINCIFYGTKCIALLFLKWTDLSIDANKNDSYFKLWSEKELKSLCKNGSEILVCSYTTVADEWRRNSGKISIKDLIVYFSTQRFIQSKASAMTAVTRKTRGIHKLTERFGATVLKSDIPNFNETDLVDLCAFYKDTVTEGTDPAVKALGKELIKSMIIVPRLPVEMDLAPINPKVA